MERTDTQFTTATHNRVRVAVGTHYRGQPAVRLTFGDGGGHQHVEVMDNPAAVRQLILELSEAVDAMMERSMP